MGVETTAKLITPEIAALLAHVRPSLDVVGIIPDSIREYDGQTTALFRTESQDLRAIGTELGIDVELLAPDGAKRVVKTERADTVILPIVIGLSLGF